MTDDRATQAIARIQALLDAYTPAQGGADIVYADAIFYLKNYSWEEAVMYVRGFSFHKLNRKSHDAYIKVRNIVGPDGFEPLEDVSDEEMSNSFDEVEEAERILATAKSRLERLVWRKRIVAGEAYLAEREAQMKGETE
jgi:hypothetical protein